MGNGRFEAAMQHALERFGVVAESTFVDAPVTGGRARVLISGEGPPVVMVNGAGTPAAMMAPLMAELPGYQLHAIDLPGSGLTDTRPSFTQDLRTNTVRFLSETLDALGLDRVTTIANSFGSLVTLWAALDMPERMVSSVHIGCPAIVLGTAAPFPMRMLSTRLGPLIMKLDPPSQKQVTRLSKVVGEHPLDPTIQDLLLETERLDGYAGTLTATYRRLIRLRGARPELSLTEDDLCHIRIPTQFIWGQDDPFGSPEVGRRVAGAMPDADLHIVPGGHAPWLGHGSEVGALTRSFLARMAKPSRPFPTGRPCP